ncbi:MAG: leucine-rich repeat domain-containing protein, partial [Firmicutes bacterium]|nr:leucine-rich repeat domain-containing protein [Bacillota bacterium]
SNRVTTIQDTAFIYCKNLTEIISNSAHYTVENKVLYDSAKTKLIKYFNDTVDYDFVAPDSVTTIVQRAFANAKLRSATFGVNCVFMSNNMFSQCTNLTTVTFKAASISRAPGQSSLFGVFDGTTKLNKIYLNKVDSNELYAALKGEYESIIEQVTV